MAKAAGTPKRKTRAATPKADAPGSTYLSPHYQAAAMLELLRDLCDRGAYDGNFSFPKDFNPLEYLFLNPDVVRAGRNAWDHFAKFGVTEKRPYSGAALGMPETGRGGR